MNQYRVSGVLTEKKSLRYTPIGLPVLEVEVQHLAQLPNEHDATVNFLGVAFGMIAQALDRISLGQLLKIDGFLRHSNKSKKLIVQIENFEII